MGKNSYHGGSTIIYPGSSWFGHSSASTNGPAKLDPHSAALRDLRELQLSYQWELNNVARTERREALIGAVREALDRGAPLPDITLIELITLGRVVKSVLGYRLRFPKASRSLPFNGRRIRLDARYSPKFPMLVWSLGDEPWLVLTAGLMRSSLGLYGSLAALQREAAESGWLISETEIADTPDRQLQMVWAHREQIKRHPLWTALSGSK